MSALPANPIVAARLMAVIDTLQAALPGSEAAYHHTAWRVHVPRTLYDRYTKQAVDGIVEVTVTPSVFTPNELILETRMEVGRRRQFAFYAVVTGLDDPHLANTIEAARLAKFFDFELASWLID